MKKVSPHPPPSPTSAPDTSQTHLQARRATGERRLGFGRFMAKHGLVRLWRRAGAGRGVPIHRVALFGAGIIVAGLAVCLWRARSRLVGAALGLMIGGALGNVLDRARHGAVTDFLDFYLGAYHWPAFNLADVAVVSGAGLLLLDSIRAKRPSSAAAKL